MADFDDLDYGDETRRHGDYVGIPHDQDQSNGSSTSDNDVDEGHAVHVDSQGNIAKANEGEAVVGVLYTYQYFGEGQPGTIKQDREATVKTSGTVKAYVESGINAGDPLEAGVTTNGVFDTSNATDSEMANYVALTDAVEDPANSGDYYAEVLIR